MNNTLSSLDIPMFIKLFIFSRCVRIVKCVLDNILTRVIDIKFSLASDLAYEKLDQVSKSTSGDIELSYEVPKNDVCVGLTFFLESGIPQILNVLCALVVCGQDRSYYTILSVVVLVCVVIRPVFRNLQQTRKDTKRNTKHLNKQRRYVATKFNQCEESTDRLSDIRWNICNDKVKMDNAKLYMRISRFVTIIGSFIVFIYEHDMIQKSMNDEFQPIDIITTHNVMWLVFSISSSLSELEILSDHVGNLNTYVEFWAPLKNVIRVSQRALPKTVMIPKDIIELVNHGSNIVFNVLDEINIHQGQNILVKGGSGNGKSLFLKHLLGYEGDLYYNLRPYHDDIIYVNQDAAKCQLDGLDIKFLFTYNGPRGYVTPSTDEVQYWLDFVCLTPNKTIDIDQPLTTLSGGEKTRFILATKLFMLDGLRGKRMAIFDEPCAGEDYEVEIEVYRKICDRFHDITTITIAHVRGLEHEPFWNQVIDVPRRGGN